MKKLQLKSKPFAENDILVVGLICPEPEYKVCWLLNSYLEIQLTNIPDLEIVNKNKKIEKFTIYRHCDEECIYNIYLIQNKGEDGFFFDKLKNFDFILVLKGDEVEKHSQTILLKLKTSNTMSIISLNEISLKNYLEKLKMLE